MTPTEPLLHISIDSHIPHARRKEASARKRAVRKRETQE
jgi:hypothetical protein